MAYNKNTDWDNEEKYLDSLMQSGDAGTKAWAESQKKELASAKAQYNTTSTAPSSSTTSGSTYTGVSSSGGSSGSSNGNSQYTITSDKGKNIAQTMKIGSTYTASDGSVWTKNNDGTITVTHGGVVSENAYTPTDYSILGQQQMEAGVGWKDVLATYNARRNKAMTTDGLEQYANDDIQDAMMQYILEAQKKDNVQNAQTAGNEWYNSYTQNNAQPTYTSKYDPRIEALLEKILTREDFSYDAATDPMYQMYANMYQREGDRAMRNTMAEVAANAGGMNSYAITAAQQAANNYSAQLNDKIPELYQLAYQMYLQDKESDVQDLGILQNMDATQYARYRDTMEDWKADRNFAYGMYKDAVDQGNWQTSFDNENYWNQLYYDNDNFWNQKNFDNENYWNQTYLDNDNYWKQTDRDDSEDDETQKNTQYAQDLAREEVWKYVSLGVMPSADLIAKAGMSEADVKAAVDAVKADTGTKSSGGGSTSSGGNTSGGSKTSGSGSSSGNGWTGSNKSGNGGTNVTVTPAPAGAAEEAAEKEEESAISHSSVTNLGLGIISDEFLLELAEAGLVIIDDKGNVKWASGVNASNYYDKLEEARGKKITIPGLIF